MFTINGYSLRKIEESDLPLILDWRNNETVRKNMYTDHIISREEHKLWFSKLNQSNDQLYFICEYNEKPIGVVNFVQLDMQNQSAYWGFYLGGTQPPSHGVAMEYIAIDYAFSVLELKKLYCEVFTFNERVIKLHHKFGFQQEKLLRAHVVKSGNPEDVASLALLSAEWELRKEKLFRLCFRQKK